MPKWLDESYLSTTGKAVAQANDEVAAREAIGAEEAGASKTMDDITDAQEVGRAVVRAPSQAAARSAMGATSASDVADAVSAQDIPGQVTAAVAADETVTDAAAAAAAARIAAADLLESSDDRVLQPVEGNADYALVELDEANQVSRYVDLQGRTWLKPHPDFKVLNANIGDDVPMPKDVVTDGRTVYALTDDEDRVAIAVHDDGTVSLKPSPATLEAFGGSAGRVIPEPSWSAKVASWNPEKALYNFHPTGLQKWFAALARAMAGTGTAHITTFVDSETYGAAATGVSQPKWLHSWPGRLRRQLDGLTGYVSGTGVAVPWNTITATPADDPRWVFGAGAAQLAGVNTADPKAGVLGRGAIRLTNDSGTGWLEFTPAEDVTEFTIWALADSGASGTATVKVDGVSVGTFDVSAAGGGGTLTRRAGTPTNVVVVDVGGLSDAGHTLRVEGPAASTVTIWGVEGGTGNGVRVSNLSRSSCAVSHLVLNDASNAYGMGLHMDAVAADLAILMLGLNDRTNNSASFTASVTTAINRIHAAGGDVLLVCPGQPDYDTLPDDLKPRLADMYGLADSFDVPLLDMAWVRQDFDTADALGLYADGIHSNDTGAEHHARFIFNTLTGV